VRSPQGSRQSSSPDLGSLATADPRTLGHQRWVLLWTGLTRLLQKEEPRAFQRLTAALQRHGLIGESNALEHGMMDAGEVVEDLQNLPKELAAAVVERTYAFAADPYVGDLRGKTKRRRVPDAELLVAYHGARWKIQGEAAARRGKVRGQSVTDQALDLIGQHYHLTPETVRSFLQDARRHCDPRFKRFIGRLAGESAWLLTMGLPRVLGLKK
jgi:hypothetical protein